MNLNPKYHPMTEEQVRALPLLMDVPTAGRAFGLSRDAAYRYVRNGGFPVPVLRMGGRLAVTKAAILAALGLEPGPSNPLPSPENVQVSGGGRDTQSEGQTP